MDGSRQFDVDQLRASMNSIDHVLIRMTPAGLSQRLFVDFRSNESTGPGVCLLPEVRSLAERIESMEKARPGFSRPERIHVVTWPLRVAALQRLDVLQAIRDRLATMDAFDALRQLEEVYAQLLQAERDELRRAIDGEGYRTLWPVTAAD